MNPDAPRPDDHDPNAVKRKELLHNLNDDARRDLQPGAEAGKKFNLPKPIGEEPPEDPRE